MPWWGSLEVKYFKLLTLEEGFTHGLYMGLIRLCYDSHCACHDRPPDALSNRPTEIGAKKK